MNDLTTARDAVRALLAPIETEVVSLRERLAKLEADREKLIAADKALAPSAKAAGKAAKPCVKKADVLAALEAIVTDNPGVAKADLIDLAKDKLSRDLGFNLSLTGRWFPECLASDVFKIAGDDTVTLTHPAAVSSVNNAPATVEQATRK